MNVRCSNCQAFYALGDVLYGGSEFKPLPPAIKVECGRCRAVFETPVPGRAAKVSHPKLTPVPRGDTDKDRAARAEASEKLARVLKPRRPGDGAGGAEHPASQAPLKAADAGDDDEFERSLRSRQRNLRVLLVVAVVAVAAVIAAIAASSLRRRFAGMPKEAQSKVEKARQKLLLDDQASLEQAAALYKDAARLAPGLVAPEADQAYALLLLAAAHGDLARRLEAMAAAERDRLARLQIEKPEGWQAAQAGLREQVARLAAEHDPHAKEADRLARQALAAAKAAIEEEPDDPAAQRAMALYWATTDADRGQRTIELAARHGERDGLSIYPKAAAALSGEPSSEKQDRALSALAQVLHAEPHLLRAIYDSAQVAFDRQQFGAAREQLDRLLQQNPAHERAKLLLARLPDAAR